MGDGLGRAGRLLALFAGLALFGVIFAAWQHRELTDRRSASVGTTPNAASTPAPPGVTWTRIAMPSCGISVLLPAGAHSLNPSAGDEFLGRAGDTALSALCMPRSSKLSKDDELAVEEFSRALTADNTVTVTKHIDVAGVPGFVAFSMGSDGAAFADVVAVSPSIVFCFSSAGPQRDLVDTVVDSIQVLPQKPDVAVGANHPTTGIPLYHSDAPLYQSSAPLYGSPTPSFGVKDVYVHPYVKKDGTVVNGYMRKHPSK